MNEERKKATHEEKMRARRNDNKNKTKLIAVLVVVALLVMAGAIYLFQSNGEKLKSATTDGFPHTVENTSQESFIKSSKSNIVFLSNTLLELINPSNGVEVKSVTHFFSKPICEVNDKYIMTYDQGRNNFRIDTANKVICESESSDNILTACIAKNGTYAVATVSGESGSKITVYSKNLKELFTWKSTDSYIIDCELTSDGNTLSVATVSSENAILKSTVYILDVRKKAEIKHFDYPNTVVADMKYVSNNDLYVISNKSCAYISNNKESLELLKNGEQTIFSYDFSSNGNVAIVFGSVENTHDFTVETFSKNGTKSFSLPVAQDIKDIASANSSVSILLGEKIEKYNMKGELIGNVATPKSANSFVQFGEKEYLLDVDKIILEKIEAVKV